MLSAAAYDIHVEQLFERVRQLHAVFTANAIPYRIVGGVAVFLHVAERDPLRARLTADVDAAIDRRHLAAVIDAAQQANWVHRHVSGIDMLVDAENPSVRSTIHLVFLHEKVRPEYVEPVPASPPVATQEGFLLSPVVDLVRMKLTSYRLKDRVHIQDLDSVGLITPEIETTLPELFKLRLAEIRRTE